MCKLKNKTTDQLDEEEEDNSENISDSEESSGENVNTGNEGNGNNLTDRTNDTGDESNTDNTADTNRTDRRTNPAEAKKNVLHRLLVTEYRNAKQNKARLDGDDAVLSGPTKGQAAIKKTQDFMNKADIVSDAASLLTNSASSAFGLATPMYKNKHNMGDTDSDKVTDGLKLGGTISNSISLVNNFYGFGSKAVKGTMSLANVRSKSARKRSAARFGAAAGYSGSLASLAGMGKNILGYNFDSIGNINQKGSKANTANKWVGAASAGFGALGAGLGIANGLNQKRYFKDISQKAASYTNQVNDNDINSASDTIKDLHRQKTQALGAPENERDPARIAQLNNAEKAQRELRHTMKAKKYSMQMAQQFNDLKSKSSVKGKLGAVAAGLGAISSVVSFTNFKDNPVWKTFLSPAISVISPVLKLIDKGVDKKSKEKEAADDSALRSNVVNEYLRAKREKVRTDFEKAKQDNKITEADLDNMNIQSADEITLNDKEVSAIALERLGINVGNNDPDDAKFKDKVFGIITQKRARHILLSPEKNDMLDSLGLDHNADINDIAQALTGT